VIEANATASAVEHFAAAPERGAGDCAAGEPDAKRRRRDTNEAAVLRGAGEIRTDNTNNLAAIFKGSSSAELRRSARRTAMALTRAGAMVERVSFLGTKRNLLADLFSRLKTSYWHAAGISPAFFASLWQGGLRPVPSIDCMAHPGNSRLPKCCMWLPFRDATYVDFFVQTFEEAESGWCFPPPDIAPRVADYAAENLRCHLWFLAPLQPASVAGWVAPFQRSGRVIESFNIPGGEIIVNAAGKSQYSQWTLMSWEPPFRD
jgi:hypothetical protein